MFLTKKQYVICCAILIISLLSLAIGLGVSYSRKTDLLPELKNAPYVGGTVTNGHECAAIGSSILQKGGSAVDAAIAALFCEGVAMPQSMGLGGGFFMTIYIRETKTVDHLNARETAPIGASEDMYKGNASLAYKGGLSVAVPGELRGYWYAHRKYGKLPWADLVQPTIDLCKTGHLVSAYLAKMFKNQEHQLLNNPSMREIFIDPKTNKPYTEGHYLKREKLAETLEVIAEQGADALYDGKLTKTFVDDVRAFNGILTEEDMKYYEPVWEPPLKTELPYGQTMYTSPLPGAGVILTFILNILSNFLDHKDINMVQNWQRIVESFKYGYGKRTELGDPAFVPGIDDLVAMLTSKAYAAEVSRNITDSRTFSDPRHYGANFSLVEDHGTAHVSVLAENGDAVSVTSTINQYFGAGIRSVNTGIILNDEMDDFSAPNITNHFGMPPSPANYIVPRKRPLSSMCPSIITDEHGDVVLVIGAAGGTKITNSVALVTMRYLWYKEPLSKAVPSSRLHHQLFPMQIDVEHDFNKEIVSQLRKIGHNVSVAQSTDGFAALTAVGKRNGIVEGSFDRRRGGQVVLIK